jgi:D-glycero-D-manno-heptose 1,7-bisphosphate phosphatase
MRKCLFLDRDGVINEDYGYVYKIEDFVFMPGIFALCREYVDKGFIIIVITNQSGIARGLFTENDFAILTDWMIQRFQDQDITITDVLFCPHHIEGKGLYKKDCYDRKPNPGLILEAAAKYNINLKESVLIGDKDSDIKAGIRAGIPLDHLFKV